MHIRIRNIRHAEQGLVSIVVTMIFLIVLSLIVVGFAQVARREQRESLDRQLSSQAFYAAESGINIAKSAISDSSGTYSSNNAVLNDKGSCGPDGTPPLNNPAYQLDGDNVKVTCILIDQTPRQLDWSSVNPTKSTVTPLRAFNQAKSAVAFETITIDWQNEDGSGNAVSSGTTFPNFGSWNSAAPVLRVELIPVPATGSNIVRKDIVTNTLTAFFRPSSGGTSTDTLAFTDASGSNRGALVEAKCDPGATDTKKCSVTITGLNSHEYYLRMKTEYKSATVSLTAKYNDSGTERVARIGGAQAEIDATGKASYVLKRIRVKMPYKINNFEYPEGVIESGDAVCKRLSVVPAPGVSKSDCTGESTPPVTENPTATPVTGGEGDAGFSACGTKTTCTGSKSGTPDYRWTYTIYNISENPSNIVAGCVWEFGDGSSKITGTPPNKANACLEDQYLKHTFPILQSPLVCRKYTVTLTIKFNNGFKDKQYKSLFYVPNGTKGTPECQAKPGGYVSYP